MRRCFVATYDRPGRSDYAGLSSRCVDSFGRFGIDVRRVSYEGWYGLPNSWMRNTLARTWAVFVHAVVDHLGLDPIWILDADLVCRSDPSELFGCEPYFDVALANGLGPTTDRIYSAGIAGFMPTAGGVATFAAWAARCRSLLVNPPTKAPRRNWLYEQDALHHAVKTVQPKVYEIPVRFHSVEGHPGYEAAEAVISHAPASRFTRETVDAP